jgi:hypothetical protein
MRYKIYEIHDSNMMHSHGMYREVPYQFMTKLESSYTNHESEQAALDAIRENRSKWVGKSLTILPVIEVPWDEKEEF